MLLDGRRGSLAGELLDVGCDVQRLHFGGRREACVLAPSRKFLRRLRVGALCVLVADVGEEFEEADLRGRSGLSNDRDGTIVDGNDCAHFLSSSLS